MGNLLYAISVNLIIAWLIGFVGYHVGGGFIHPLLVLSVIAITAILLIVFHRRKQF